MGLDLRSRLPVLVRDRYVATSEQEGLALAEAKLIRKNPAAVTLGRKGGKVKSEAKAEAARENGKRGGRPRKRKQ
jgi:hypothetical protein